MVELLQLPAKHSRNQSFRMIWSTVSRQICAACSSSRRNSSAPPLTLSDTILMSRQGTRLRLLVRTIPAASISQISAPNTRCISFFFFRISDELIP